MGDSSILLDLLVGRSERRETRIFAHASAETQECITDAQGLQPPSTSRPVTSQGAFPSRPTTSQTAGFLEVFPRVPSHPPRLLQELEALLVDRLRTNDRLASTSLLLAKERDPGMAANLALDGHRQVLSAFIHGFSSYSSLLGRIQAAFEQTLKDGLHCAVENTHMRERMQAEALKRRQASAQAHTHTMTSEQSYRQAAFAKLQQARSRLERATKRAAATERERDRLRRQEAALEQSVVVLRSRHARLKALAAREVAHAQQPISGHLLALKIKPLTAEDKELLEQEHGGNSVAYVLGEEPPPTAVHHAPGADAASHVASPHPSADLGTPFATAPDSGLLPPGPVLSPRRQLPPVSLHSSAMPSLTLQEGEQLQLQQQQQQQHGEAHGQHEHQQLLHDEQAHPDVQGGGDALARQEAHQLPQQQHDTPQRQWEQQISAADSGVASPGGHAGREGQEEVAQVHDAPAGQGAGSSRAEAGVGLSPKQGTSGKPREAQKGAAAAVSKGKVKGGVSGAKAGAAPPAPSPSQQKPGKKPKGVDKGGKLAKGGKDKNGGGAAQAKHLPPQQQQPPAAAAPAQGPPPAAQHPATPHSQAGSQRLTAAAPEGPTQAGTGGPPNEAAARPAEGQAQCRDGLAEGLEPAHSAGQASLVAVS